MAIIIKSDLFKYTVQILGERTGKLQANYKVGIVVKIVFNF